MAEFLYSLNASTLRSTSVLEQIEAAGAAGFVGIELWFDAVDAYVGRGGQLSDIRRALADHGLAVPTMIYLGDWFDCAESVYPEVREECKRRMGIAAELTASYVIAGPPLGHADYAIGARRYRELLEIGEKFDVKPAMEFLGFVDQLNTIEEALTVMELAGCENATTVLDPAHIYRSGGSVESIAKLSPSQIAICHYDDCPSDVPREVQMDEDRVMPGDGVFDLQRYLQLLRQIGYCGYLSLELFREDLWSRDPMEVAREGYQKMRQTIET